MEAREQEWVTYIGVSHWPICLIDPSNTVLKNVVNGFWRPKQYFTIAKQWPTGINKYFHRCIITRSAELNELNRGNRAGRNLAIKHKSIELASYRQMTTTARHQVRDSHAWEWIQAHRSAWHQRHQDLTGPSMGRYKVWAVGKFLIGL